MNFNNQGNSSGTCFLAACGGSRLVSCGLCSRRLHSPQETTTYEPP